MKAKVLSEVYDIFDPQEALSGDKLREYYVKRESPVKSLADILSSEKPLKYLFVGSRGNGKSTELNRLSELVKDDEVWYDIHPTINGIIERVEAGEG